MYSSEMCMEICFMLVLNNKEIYNMIIKEKVAKHGNFYRK